MKSKKELKPFELVQIHLHYLDHFMKEQENEKVKSEQMIKFFLSLAAGITVLLSTVRLFSNSGDDLLSTIQISLALLFYLGLFVFARVIWSDRTIKMKDALKSHSYNSLKKLDDSIKSYKEIEEKLDLRKFYSPIHIFQGTLTQMIIIVEVIIVAVIMFISSIIQEWNIYITILSILLSTAIIILGLYLWRTIIRKDVDQGKVKTVLSQYDLNYKQD